jgi:hypothetical protein
MPSTLRVRLQAALTSLVLAAGVAASFAVDSGTALPQAGGRVLALIQKSSLRLEQYPSVSVQMRISVEGNGQKVSIDGSGAFDPRSRNGTFSESLPQGLGTFQAINLGSTMYAKVDPAHIALAGGKHWVGLSVAGINQQNPGTSLGYLRILAGAHGTVSVVGHDTIDGAATTHYRVDIDPAEAAKRVPPQFRTGPDQLAAAGIHSIPVDVWLDGSGLPRQEEIRASAHGVTSEISLHLRGSQDRLHIRAPAPADVLTVTSLADLMPYVINR